MQLGMIGLGRGGPGVARRLMMVPAAVADGTIGDLAPHLDPLERR